MNARDDLQFEFDYPVDRLFELRKIMTAAQVKTPNNNQDLNGEPVQYVIKRGLTTFTTIGRLSRFESHKRHYSLTGTFDSIETMVLPYDNRSVFSRGGDSGALIVGHEGEFVALLTSGTGSIGSCDITYGTLIDWLWNDKIKPQFPGANLYFEIADD